MKLVHKPYIYIGNNMSVILFILQTPLTNCKQHWNPSIDLNLFHKWIGQQSAATVTSTCALNLVQFVPKATKTAVLTTSLQYLDRLTSNLPTEMKRIKRSSTYSTTHKLSIDTKSVHLPLLLVKHAHITKLFNTCTLLY